MNNVIIKNDVKIENMIYEIRGKQVMLDSDLAKLYNVETKRINEAVKNNIEKFPERYCFIIINNSSNGLTIFFLSLFIFLVILCFIYYNHLYYNNYTKNDCEKKFILFYW